MLSEAPPQWLWIIQISALAALGAAVPVSLGLLLWHALAEEDGGYVRIADASDKGDLDALSRFTADILGSVTDIGPVAGKSIHVERFWQRVKLRRYLLLLGQVASTGTDVFLAYRRLGSAWSASSILISFVRVSVSVYAMVLAWHYSQTRTISIHTRLTHHLFALSALSIAPTYFCTFGQYLSLGYRAEVSTAEYATLGFAVIQTALAGLVPLRPGEYLDLRGMYSTAVADALAKAPQNEDAPNVTPERSACIFSMLTQTWAFSTVQKAEHTDQLDVQDLTAVQPYLHSQNIVLETMDHTNPALRKSRLGPIAAVLWAVWSPEWVAVTQEFVLTILLSALGYLQHFCLQQFLWSVDQTEDMRTRIAWASAMVAVPLLIMAIYVVQDYITYSRLSPRMTAHASLLLYMKLLTRNTLAASPASPEEDPAGNPPDQADILNLVSNDALEIRGLGMEVMMALETLVSLACGCFYAWRLLGISGVVGLSSMVVVVVPAYFMLKQSYRLTNGIVRLGDERVALLKEAIQAIAMIKMMAAERFWFLRISRLRDRAYSKSLKRNLLQYLSSALFELGPELLIVISFAHYTLVLGKDLTPDIAFTAIAVFGELRPSLAVLPGIGADLAESLIACRRITDFLRARDVDYLTEDHRQIPSLNDEYGFRNATVGWDIPRPSLSGLTDGTERVPFQLQDLNVTFPQGKLTLITGRFGSGKTLMLLAVLGEASLISGEILYAHSAPLEAQAMQDDGEWVMASRGVAYAPQTTWLQSKSIRDNILFGLPMHVERYKRVVHASGLLPDLEILEDGDLTEIGERGKILSGGQKARVSLARAVYSRALTVILDDVMSAVDAQTAQHIVQYCFNSDLMAGRTVIIASHAVEALAPLASHAVFLQEGRAIWQGTGRGLLASKHMAHLQTDGDNHRTDSQSGEPQETPSSALGGSHSIDSFDVKVEVHKTPRQLIVDEERRKGTTELRLWTDLAKQNGGVLFWLGIVAFLILTNGLPVLRWRVLEEWSGQQGKSKGEMTHFVILFSSVSLATILASSAFQVYRLLGALRALRRTFQVMLENLLRAKMPFFTKTRAGSIVQRFGPDLTSIQNCSRMIAIMASTALGMVVALISVTIYGGPLFFAAACCVGLAVIKPSKAYRTCARQLQRLQAIVPGPILSTYSETIAGTAVIRAFGAQSLLFDELLRLQNMKMVAFAWRGYLLRWWYVIMRCVDLAIVSSALGVVLLRSDIDGAAAGFILTFSALITSRLREVLAVLRQVEISGINLERVADFCALEKEEGYDLKDISGDADAVDPNDSVAPGWPFEGKIEVKGLCARYGPDMPDILHGVTFSVEGGERVGIVGATGGGKSTLAKSFFSFVDLTAGSIKIDGRDIATLPLGVVRSRLGIIAQDPILLSGTLRLNLDIDGRHSDAELYDALRQVQLIRPSPQNSLVDLSDAEDSQTAAGASSETASLSTTIAGSEGGKSLNSARDIRSFDDLDYEIKAGGENLSAGQKQLIVLARALLKNQKILILDEATASIDSATDAEISRIVHQGFQGATVLIIAHRLRTIMPCSKILVMDNGRLIQQGPPLELIQEDGKFRDLCSAAGPEEFGHLLSIAEKHKTSLLE